MFLHEKLHFLSFILHEKLYLIVSEMKICVFLFLFFLNSFINTSQTFPIVLYLKVSIY